LNNCVEASHRFTLFDINRFLGDVLPTDEVVAYLNGFAG
jgi:hypothetical protein